MILTLARNKKIKLDNEFVDYCMYEDYESELTLCPKCANHYLPLTCEQAQRLGGPNVESPQNC